MIDPKQSVASVVLEHSETASIFQRHRIDFCCRGELPVEAACAERGLETKALVDELSQAIAGRRGEAGVDPRGLSTSELIAHIVSTHHAYLRQTLPFVERLAAKVHRVHGEHNPKLVALDAAVQQLSELLVPHLDDEEQTLFPAMTAASPSARLEEQLTSMQEEHLAVGRLLEQVRSATDDFELPEWACNSYRTLFSELEALEGDVLKHVHLENHVLKPRFAPKAG